MNRSKIEYVDHTWNPITGCLNNCPYCYARKMACHFAGDVRLNKMAKQDYTVTVADDGQGQIYVLDKPMASETGSILAYPFDFEPTLHRYRYGIPGKLKMGNNIFVGAMADMFGDWIPDSWIYEVFSVCADNPIHNYLFMTKNPARYQGLALPKSDNMWFGTSITKEHEMDRFNHLPASHKTYISFEPVLEDLHPEKDGNLFGKADWIIIGAESGRTKGKVTPESGWIKKIVLMADTAGVPVFMRDSLAPVVGEGNMRREYPEQLRHSEMSPKMKLKMYGVCAVCNSHMKKSEMLALLARSKRGEQPKQYCFMCLKCFADFCDRYNVQMPKLKMMENITDGKENCNGKEKKLQTDNG